jgi:hypothetical protein
MDNFGIKLIDISIFLCAIFGIRYTWVNRAMMIFIFYHEACQDRSEEWDLIISQELA